MGPTPECRGVTWPRSFPVAPRFRSPPAVAPSAVPLGDGGLPIRMAQRCKATETGARSARVGPVGDEHGDVDACLCGRVRDRRGGLQLYTARGRRQRLYTLRISSWCRMTRNEVVKQVHAQSRASPVAAWARRRSTAGSRHQLALPVSVESAAGCPGGLRPLSCTYPSHDTCIRVSVESAAGCPGGLRPVAESSSPGFLHPRGTA